LGEEEEEARMIDVIMLLSVSGLDMADPLPWFLLQQMMGYCYSQRKRGDEW